MDPRRPVPFSPAVVHLFAALILSFSSLPSEALAQEPGGRSPPGEAIGCEGQQVDICGVCAGDGSSCEVVSGTFSRSILSMGYHRILEIPIGAQELKIQETVKSRNYLAIRTSTGESVINGNWVIDRPGIFYAAGTTLTYRRPNEIRSKTGESITAPGPTQQELHIYMIYQQPNPSIYYEYVLPRANIPDSEETPGPDIRPIEPLGLYPLEEQGFVHPDASGKENSIGGVHSNHVLSETSPPTADGPSGKLYPGLLPPYIWSATGTTPCSATCGTGRRHVVFGCVEQLTLTPAPADFCEPTQLPGPREEHCHTQPCPAFWDVGEWSECSKTCGPGFQNRQVLCRRPLGNQSTGVVGPEQCGHLESPETIVSCQLKICSEWQIRSEWTSCSVPCGVGQRTREVLCVDNLGDVVMDEECNMKLRPPDVENCDMGPCARSWFFSPWSERCSADCGEGRRSRSVVCLTNYISSLPLDGCGDEVPDESSLCDIGPCHHKFEWYTGQWGQCSAECGNGTQTRSVVCMLHSDGHLDVASPSNCSHLPRPTSTQPCFLKRCGATWYVTEWSACSRSCDGGYRVREVRCLADDKTISIGCDPTLVPKEREECNMQACIPEIDENCRDMYYNCNVVVQARLCVYSYYRRACCVSCTRVSRRESQLRRR
ncbi:thrombospondin type-1 domain-containing protein 4 [Scleropages formosus]|uniref:thrombospondin type-1 domain-containing protein 4 n=1 Tax=Scleropages formosus TaxID=113540 RepID=UPI0008780BB6|nr:thrombospondin type-1 domain-containing protein 4-like [Scleropages formosus]